MLFTAWFVPTTALDLWITWFGIYHLPERIERFGIVEGNPYTDLSSVYAFVMPEVVAFFIGIVLVFSGGMLKTRRLAALGQRLDDLRQQGYWTFCKQYNKAGQFTSYMILIHIVVAVGRVEPVVNNIMWLAIGWGPTALFGAFTAVVACGIAVFPMYYMIRRWT